MSGNKLSANTLFHFTEKKENLISILRNEFYPRYSLENWTPVLGFEREVAIPMVCFCDIPLSQIYNHTEFYGCYALGLRKEWGIRHKINPIIYTYSGSLSATHLSSIINKVRSDGSDLDDYINFLSFIKPYKGKLWQDGDYRKEEILFYDEREWRYIPKVDLKTEGIPNAIGKDEFLNKDFLSDKHKKLESKPLSFEPNDIKYIIVKDEAEIYDMASEVRNIKGKFPYQDVEILITRIISMAHIKEDF
jgi:hypothetical protein